MIKFRNIIIFLSITYLKIPCALGYESFLIKNIRVNGLTRIEAGAIFINLPVKVGDYLTPSKSEEIIHKLYSTGFFVDIKLEQQGNILIIDVNERSVISELSITGDKVFDHDTLTKSLKENGLGQGKIFKKGVLDQAIFSLKSEYYNKGLYSVEIKSTVIELSRNRVSISISIDEGPTAKIHSITFTGNKVFSNSDLNKQMFLNTGNWLSWWLKDNHYSSDKLSADIEKIRNFYLNEGYINFKINSVQVQLSANKTNVYITINVSEGSRYYVNKINISGNFKNINSSELYKDVLIKSGEIVNQEKVNKTAENIKTTLGNYGYAFASVNPIPEIVGKTVNYNFFIDTDKRVYVRKINILGNKKTRDVVIRREIRQVEDELYNSTKIQRSKERLNLLGYFKTTDISTTPVPGFSNQVDMNVKVDEVNTGSINFGLGYAQGQGILLNGSISQSNLFGSGKSASLSASTSALNQTIQLSFTDPYFISNGTSLGYDIYNNTFSPNLAGISAYSTQTIGAKVRLGVPVSEYDKINFSLGFENNQINLTSNIVPLRFAQFQNVFGSSVNAVPLSIGWVRNTTDNTLWPTTGALYNQTFDMTLPYVGAQYYRFTSQDTWFVPLFNPDIVWKSNAMFGSINSYGNSQVPFYQNYFLGGISSIRGYYIGTLGPRDTDGSSLGGTNEATWSNDILVPMPGVKEAHTVRLSAFFDMASLWGGNSFGLTPIQSFRASYGAGLTWISPLGPIKVTYAFPLFNQPNDNLQPFQFLLGTSF